MLDSDATGDVYASVAVALAKQNSTDKIIEAEKLLKQGKEKFPDNVNLMAAAAFVAYIHSCSVASPVKRDAYLDAAENLCNRAIKANSNNAVANLTLGLVKLVQDDAGAATAPLRKNLELEQTPTNCILLAHALLKLNPKDKEGELLVRKALQSDEYFYPAYVELARVNLANGKYEEASTRLNSVPNEKRDADWSLIKGDLYSVGGVGQKAVEFWRVAVRLNPQEKGAYQRLCDYYASHDDKASAINQILDAVEMWPYDMKLRQRLKDLAGVTERE